MLIDRYDPLEEEMLNILDKNGKIVDPNLEPFIENDNLLKMYQTMLLAKVADIKALQYQRQGRMLTYAPNRGQEAAQVGSIAATDKNDWLVPAFRELGAWLYKGVSLEQVFLYWYGNEMGSKFPEDVKMLPVSVPIASQLNHAVGIAMASKIKREKDVAIAYVGDGGTSQGEFHEAVNFAAVFNAPVVFLIQNNQWAISVPRSVQTKSKTLAQKALAYGIPGIQVDGNDVLAVYAATKEAVERARNGEGPTIIEAVTYRLGPHTTSDDPTIYRDVSEVTEWEKKDPIDRFKKYLIDKGLWSEDKDKSKYEEYENYVGETFKKVEGSGFVPLEDIFKYTYAEMTPNLIEQYEEYKKHIGEEGA
ncbi:pyruvate dehydrogenase (acetyl-transferring) E1 component subunit alpha [Proteiniborus sp. MB09-C3]|uniref:pyruvate dehydrogenase (acetyl-transferring) E1 component subunit alpha n=1 Tax=Proteiniborus sp. MB09-C3 TaxID=3050072 RepID=UPI002552EA77|nr:pyruvate dehydrogenase (acetyl-transferring) E1 component subunit alpha [Proteiniborus sp. MB09-C3]WIV13392.1 pyruvate dehydrogenase (acetyl-transferring) E1 component subunit alpha [Proteiniborus sp. MB09-C3]